MVKMAGARTQPCYTSPSIVKCLVTQLQEIGDGRVSRITEAMGPDNHLVGGSMSRREKLQQLVEQKDWSHLSQEQR